MFNTIAAETGFVKYTSTTDKEIHFELLKGLFGHPTLDSMQSKIEESIREKGIAPPDNIRLRLQKETMQKIVQLMCENYAYSKPNRDEINALREKAEQTMDIEFKYAGCGKVLAVFYEKVEKAEQEAFRG